MPPRTGDVMNFSGAAASVLGRDAMRALDAATIAAGTPSLELMERAGRALAEALADPSFHGVPLPERPRLLVVAGRGNNGGDGFVVARLLASLRWRCTVALLGEPATGGDAATNLAEWRRVGGRVIDRAEVERELEAGAGDYDLGLDAIFGTGLVRSVEDPDATLIRQLNQSGLPVVACDIPSGLCSDTGCPLGIAVQARATLTIGAAKPGLFVADGPDYCGRVRVADIGLLDPAAGHETEAGSGRLGFVLDPATTGGAWPRLTPLAHKGSRGHVLIVAGSRGKTGAAVLAARGAFRGGAGLVTIASGPEVQAVVTAAIPEAMTLALEADSHGRLATTGLDALEAAAATAGSMVAGPGLGMGPGGQAALQILMKAPGPLVLDADALNLVSALNAGARRALFALRTGPPPILTPHPGEMSRLAGVTTAQVQVSRHIFADKVAQELSSVLVLKGAATVVSDGARRAFNLSGNAGMAVAGMGDVLAGLCGALAVRAADSFEAACLAVWAHGAAGDEMAGQGGPGFLAGELADRIPAVLASRWPR